jgi:branched-chain amino acid transport system ATP-binding protein
VTMTLLTVENLTVRFGSTIGVRDVSLEAPAGRITGVLGANGAGKTTTLLGILGHVPRVSGRVVLDGQDVTDRNTVALVRAGIALCPENRRLFPGMSIEDNLLLGAFGRGRREERMRLAEAYERFPWIRERRGEPAGRLSGGQQETVAIARSLMSRPKLLLLDEPSSGLSPVAIAEVRSMLEEVARDGTGVLLVEQNVKLVQSLCDTAWVLAHGQVRDSGQVAELLSGARVTDAYLGGLAITEGAAAAGGSAPGRPEPCENS